MCYATVGDRRGRANVLATSRVNLIKRREETLARAILQSVLTGQSGACGQNAVLRAADRNGFALATAWAISLTRKVVRSTVNRPKQNLATWDGVLSGVNGKVGGRVPNNAGKDFV